MGKTSTDSKRKYNEKAYDRIEVTVPKGDKAKYKVHAEIKDGGSLNSFIKRAMAETLERDNSDKPAPDTADNKPAPNTDKQTELTPSNPPKAVKSAETMSDDEFLARVNALKEYHKSDGEADKAEREENENADT